MKKLLLLLLFPFAVLGQVHVKGYTRSNGTYVKPHERTRPNSTVTDNYSYPGNYNPNTGRVTGGNPSNYGGYSKPTNTWHSSNDDKSSFSGEDYDVSIPAGKMASPNLFNDGRAIRYSFTRAVEKQATKKIDITDDYIGGNVTGEIQKGDIIRIIGVDYDSYRIDNNGQLGYIPYFTISSTAEFKQLTLIETVALTVDQVKGDVEYRRVFDDAPMYEKGVSSSKVLQIIPRNTIVKTRKADERYWWVEYDKIRGFINDSKISADKVQVFK